jgi:hypothetical protein
VAVHVADHAGRTVRVLLASASGSPPSVAEKRTLGALSVRTVERRGLAHER